MKKILLITLLALVTFGFKCNKQSTPGIDDKDVFKGVLSNDETFKTQAGAIIASERDIDPAWGVHVDGGLADLFRIAAAPPNNYDVSSLSAPMYRVWIYPRSPHCENPAFLVDASWSPYEGTEWDKDPSPRRCLICAAGMTVMQGNPITGAGMIITNDVGIMRTIVRYEGEHSLLFYLDPVRYNDTMYHLTQGHPLLGDGPAEGLASSQHKAVHLKLPGKVESEGFTADKGQDACVLLTK